MRILSALIFIGLASETWAQDLLIDMTTDGAFSVGVAHLDVGQNITWLPIARGHNLEFAKGPTGANLPQNLDYLRKCR